MEISFLQQFDFIPEWHKLLALSIPQVAFSPENDTFITATLPLQICMAIDKCMPESRIRNANNMENSFFNYKYTMAIK
jgi:hypothetical protein